MRFLEFMFAKKYLITIVLILIIIILSLIFVIDRYGPNNNLGITVSSNLKDLDLIKSEAKKLSSVREINSNGTYTKILSQINSLEDKKTSRKEDKYKIVRAIWENVLGLYSDTNRNELYNFQIIFNDFIKKNYPDKDQFNLKPLCLDPNCAEKEQPKEIQSVIEKINKSSIVEPVKESDIQSLKNFGYINDNWAQLKVNGYLDVAYYIKDSKYYTDAKINEEIYNQIINYIKNTYPNEYEEFIKNTIPSQPERENDRT